MALARSSFVGRSARWTVRHANCALCPFMVLPAEHLDDRGVVADRSHGALVLYWNGSCRLARDAAGDGLPRVLS